MPILAPALLAATTAGTSITAARRCRQRRKLKRVSQETVLSADVAPQLIRPNDTEEAVNHYFAANSLSLGMTLGGLIFHPLMVAGLPLNIYTTLPAAQSALRKWREEQRLSSETLEATLVMGTMTLGWLVPSAAISWGYSFGRKLKHQLHGDLTSFVEKLAQSPHVWTEVNGTELQVPLDQIESGDILVIQKNNIAPLPGRVTKGEATINTYLVTQNSESIEVTVGDMIPPLTIVMEGKIYIEVSK